MERIYYRYELWEDYQNGMYNECKQGREQRVVEAAHILGDAETCLKAMKKVISEWKISTEYNLSNNGVNRKAWLGQAACSCYANIHEDETREAWGLMTEEQRIEANRIAQTLINQWERECEKEQISQMSIFDEE